MRSGPGPGGSPGGRGRWRPGPWPWLLAAAVAVLASGAAAQCPWHRDVKELQSSCICAYNLGQELSVQCDMVDFPRLLSALDRFARDASLDLLYVNNSTVAGLADDAFRHLRLKSVQLSGCRIRSIAPHAFRHQEATLKNLNLQDNELSEVPVESLRGLRNLTLLDLSRNRIERVPGGAFATLHSLATLKLADNNLSLAADAFQGLEDTLKNLNLKGTRQKRVPEAIKGLRTLAFLDLAQNGLRELPGPAGAQILEGLHALSALNLERNLIQSVGETTFRGVRDTLSSLSLLNNLLTEFPASAVSSLHELRVLDIGFNLLTELPVNAFTGTPSLTLLALDGNPLSGVPEKAVAHLNTTLRGLSLGGRFLSCDCGLRWVAEWIARGDLQVTSRERNPQFCGSPAHLKDRSFYAIQPAELKCGGEKEREQDKEQDKEQVLADESESKPVVEEQEDALDADYQVVPAASTTTTTTTTTTKATTVPTTTTTSTTARPTTTTVAATTTTTTPPPPTAPPTTTPVATTTTTTTPRPTYRPTYKTRPPTTPTAPPTAPPTTSTTTTSTTTRRGNGLVAARTTAAPGVWRSNAAQQGSAVPAPAAAPVHPTAHAPGHGPGLAAAPGHAGSASMHRPPLVLGSFPAGNHAKHTEPEEEVKVRSAYRQDNSIIIQWDSHTANILGFRVVYRLFGDKSFKQGPPLEASEREFKIKNVPSQECIVVCVISLEEVNVAPETVPYGQCREVRTVTSPTSNMDKITIAASAAICGTVVIAVIVFVAASRRRTRKLHTLQQHGSKNGIPAGGSGLAGLGGGLGLPVGCCGPTPSPAGPLSSLATLSAFTNHKDWDQVSVYSNRSMGRAPRMYHVERQGSINAGCAADDVRTHASHFKPKTRSIADGQSQHSFSNHSGRYLSSGNSFAHGPGLGLVNSPQELRHSRQSLAVSDRMSRVSYPASHAHQPSVASSRRQRPRSRTRDSATNQSMAHGHAPSMTRPGSRYSAAGSTHTLNNYCDTSDNWTDHDMDIYMARNPTTRTGLVPL
ncbi:hypothetical protein ONE63_004469 [Megalurothrips usitatus]|uniref:Uncharacterized protein n=1 Tax=Megalurothrips usitatus TaxID=439358 RepID=A0AAV7X5F1_9NEOP|nr:hypothetical protein ONE63_004469 [Megalurothrips usitatus]